MKKLLRLFMLAVLFLPFALHAQLGATYMFSTDVDDTQWYTLTSDSTVLKVGTGNDSYATPVTNIGFTFNFAGVDYTQFSANSDGTVRLGGTAVGTTAYNNPFNSTNAGTNAPKICGLGCDGYMVPASGNSPADYIAYQLFGTDGDHVLVIEISTGTYNSSTRDNHYTFQVQLAEADNSVTLAYSPIAPAAGPAVTYQLGACTGGNDIVLFNVPSNTMSVYTSGTSDNNASGTWPEPGRYYTIAPNPNPCYPVTSLETSDITSTSVTISWADSNNTNATYTIYNGETMVTTNFDGNSYNITGLEANTSYTFSVITDCSSDNMSNPASITVHTACGIISTLPFTEDFEEVPSGSYQMPYCWERYASEYTSTATYPYSYNSTTYAHSGTRSLYFYGTTDDAYSDTMMAIMPELDVTTYPMDGNRVTFWARMSAANTSKNIYVGTMTDPTNPATFVLVDSVLVSTNVLTMYSAPLTNASGAYVAFVVYKGTGTIYMDDVTLELLPSCLEVSNVTATDISSTSVTIEWTDDQNTDASYSVYISDSLVGSTIETSYTIYDLTPNTTYTFGVEANCSNGDGNVMTINATTSCAPEALPFSETFDVSLSDNACWRGATGTTAEEVLAGTALTYTANTQWTYTSSTSNGLPAGHYRVNIWGSSCKKWMITPEIDLTTASNPLLTFDAAFTEYSSTSTAPASGFEENTSQLFMVLATTDNGQTWTTVSNISLASLASSSYLTQYLDLTAFAGDTVRIAFYAQSTTSGGDNNLHIDNILIEESTGDLCLPVTNLSANNITADAATLTWVGNADSYNVYSISAGDTILLDNVTDDSLELSSLNPMTAYTYGVRAVCYGDESPMVTVTFYTACTALTLPYTETFEATSNTLNCWTSEGSGNWSIGTGDYSTSTGAFQGSQNAKITHSVTDNVTTFISPVLDDVQNGLVLDFAYVLRSWSGDIDELSVLYRVDADSAWQVAANYTDPVSTWTTETVIIPGTVYQIAFEHTDNYGYGVGIDSVVFTPMSADFCYSITNLAVTDVTSSSISLAWVDEENDNATYTIYNMTDNTVIAAGITGTDYEITGLTYSTTYTFGVVANCSSTSESSISTISATTTCADGGCQITIVGNDSWGDGWNGNAINVIQDSIIIGTFTLDNGTTFTRTYTVCSSSPVSFSWTSGNYPGETSFNIYDGGNIMVYNASGSDMANDSVFFTMNEPCPSCLPATNLTATEVTSNSVTLSWTGNAPSYDIYNGETFVTNVTTNTYTITGLDVATTYTFGVQAICSATESATTTTINVMTNCSDVTTLPYYEGFEDGLGCWFTINGSSDGQPWSVNSCSSLTNVDPHGGAYVASSWSWSGSAMHANAWLISPKFVLPNTTDSITLTWWENTNPSYSDSYRVVLSTTDNDTAAFTTVVYPYTQAAGTWTIKTVDLTAYAGQSIYLAFHHQDYDENYLLIDDIALFEGGYIPPAPDTLTVTFAVNDATMGTTIPAPGTYQYLSGDSVFFGSQANAGYQFQMWEVIRGTGTNVDTLTLDPTYANNYYVLANSWMSFGNIIFKAYFEADSTTTQYTVTLNTADATMGSVSPAGATTVNAGSSFTATATANSGYEFVAWMDGTTQVSTANPYTFTVNANTTLTATFAAVSEPCEAPTNLREQTVVVDKAVGYLFVEWDDNAGVSQWNLQYKLANTNDWHNVVVSGTPTYAFENLEANEVYNLRVQAICAEDNFSDWSNVLTATAQGVGINDHLLNSVSLYPNPANDVINVQCTMYDVQMVEVIDVYGKLIQTLNVTDNPTSINVSNLASGMYFVRVTTEEGVATKSFIKK